MLEKMMDKCGCKGIRKCYICDKEGVVAQNLQLEQVYWYCPKCTNMYHGNINNCVGTFTYSDWCELHQDSPPQVLANIQGVYIEELFITSDEESDLVDLIYREEWKLSQSGRMKQDYGPKVNFKRKKLKSKCFSGLPAYAKFLTERLKRIDLLRSFVPVELCNLEYTPERGSSIEPHIDDTWLWGEHLVTINLLSRTILTLTKHNCDYEIQIPMSARSLLVLHDTARYEWMHSIKPAHITEKRLALTIRNLSEEFGANGANKDIGNEIMSIALSFQVMQPWEYSTLSCKVNHIQFKLLETHSMKPTESQCLNEKKSAGGIHYVNTQILKRKNLDQLDEFLCKKLRQ